MVFVQVKAILLSVNVFTSLWSATLASEERRNPATDALPAEDARTVGSNVGWSASAPEATRPGYWPSGHEVSGSVSTNNPASRVSSVPSVAPPSSHSGPLQTPHEAVTNDSRGSGPVCSNGLRLAFDCALKRVVAFGVRDHLIEKYKLPMVPLDVCQADTLMDVEQCIPHDFVDAFPSDTMLEVVRQKRLTVGTMDLNVFPQLAADQGYTTGFYPELLQAVVRELTVIALQNHGLRRELLGDRQLDIPILEQPFSKRVKDIKAAVAREWLYGVSCEGPARMAVRGLQQLAVSPEASRRSTADSLPKKEGQTASWQDGLLCADSPAVTSSCQLYGCLSPWDQIPKDVLIEVTHVKFSTPLNLVAAVHRGEVHMTDVGTIASAYLPERYNFLPLREVLEPSCTTGAWKSFFLLPSNKRRRERRSHSGERGRKRPAVVTIPHDEQNPAGFTAGPLALSEEGNIMAKDFTRAAHGPAALAERQYGDAGEPTESWEKRVSQTRRLFFLLYGVQEEGLTRTEGQSEQHTSAVTVEGIAALSTGQSLDEDAAYEEKTLLKLHHVDHFTFSYLFPEDFRICSVRKLTGLSSLLSDGESLGAFGYGLAGRGGRRRIFSGSSWQCSAKKMRGLNTEMRRDEISSLMAPNAFRRKMCDLQSTGRSSIRQDGGFPLVMEFPGPLVPLAAFFAKSRDPACRGSRRRRAAAVMHNAAPATSGVASKPLSLFSAVILGAFATMCFALV